MAQYNDHTIGFRKLDEGASDRVGPFVFDQLRVGAKAVGFEVKGAAVVVMGVEATPSTPQQADAHIRAEVERWLKTLKPPAR